jgi:hypothetical protein
MMLDKLAGISLLEMIGRSLIVMTYELMTLSTVQHRHMDIQYRLQYVFSEVLGVELDRYRDSDEWKVLFSTHFAHPP